MMYGMRTGTVIVALLAGLSAAVPAPAHAAASQEQIDALGTCIRLSTTGKDRIATARWMIGAIGSAPQVTSIVTVDPAKKIEADKAMAALFTRLLTVDCFEEAKPLFKTGAASDVGEASRILGEIAMQEVMTNKTSTDAIGAFANYIDEADFTALRD